MGQLQISEKYRSDSHDLSRISWSVALIVDDAFLPGTSRKNQDMMAHCKCWHACVQGGFAEFKRSIASSKDAAQHGTGFIDERHALYCK